MHIGTSIEVESTSTIPNLSPVPGRHLKVTRHNLNVPEGSKLTINTAFGSQLIDADDLRQGLRPRRLLSSIASSSDEQKKSQNTLDNKIRECRSLDPLPGSKKHEVVEGKQCKGRRRSTRSLENCDKCGVIQIIAIPEDKLINNNFPNGNLLSLPNEENGYIEDVQVPLLNNVRNPQIRKRGGSTVEDTLQNTQSKR